MSQSLYGLKRDKVNIVIHKTQYFLQPNTLMFWKVLNVATRIQFSIKLLYFRFQYFDSANDMIKLVKDPKLVWF